MANATTNDVTMDTLDALIIESIKTIRYSKKKRPNDHTIHDVLRKEGNLIEVGLADINDRLAFRIKEGKLKNQPSNGKNPFLLSTITLTLPMAACLKLIMLLPQVLLVHV